MRNYLLLLLIVSGLLCSAQPAADSLYQLYLREKTDTSKVNLLLELAGVFREKGTVQWLSYSREAADIAAHIGYQDGLVKAELQIADYYYSVINYPDAVRHYLKAMRLAEELDMVHELTQCYNGLGIIFSNQKKHDQALKYFIKVSRLAEKRGKKRILAVSYNNLGITYKNLKRYVEAQDNYMKAMQLFRELNFERGIASAANNMGIVASEQGRLDDALRFYDEATASFRKLNDTAAQAGIYTNIGEVYSKRGEYRTALSYHQKALHFAQKYDKKHFRLDAYDGLSEVYESLGNYKEALFYRTRHLELSDSINNEEEMQQVQDLERRAESERQERELQLLKQKEEIQKLKVRSQQDQLQQSRLILYFVGGALVVVLALSFFLFRTIRALKTTNQELAHRRKEIQDSINYARNIQQAMLPDVSVLGKFFPEGFGLFLPKDVVSGDFYWCNELGDSIYFAVADCTGHGVPGAFMSMIGIDKLNQSLIDQRIAAPGKILSSLNSSIKRALRQEGDAVASRDGMDIALCCFDKSRSLLTYAGANRPLWIIRNGEVMEYKPTKASVAGYTEFTQEYSEISVPVQKGDSLYLFSDGYADQFGGEKRKKMLTSRFREELLEISDEPMQEQEKLLQAHFNSWRGSMEQVDDVLILGLRIG